MKSLIGSMFAMAGAVLLVGTPAHADDAASKEQLETVTLSMGDRVDGTTGGDAVLATTLISDTGTTFGLRIEAFYEHFMPSGLGVFGSANASSAFTNEGDGDSVFGLGNLEVGGAYAGRAGQLAGLVHAGVAVPTAAVTAPRPTPSTRLDARRTSR